MTENTGHEQLKETKTHDKKNHWVHMCWAVVWIASLGAMYWWYEVRPGAVVLERMQGTWQPVQGVFPNETPLRNVWHIEGNDSWLSHPMQDEDDPWRATHSEIMSIRPARNFFVVRRSYGKDWGRNERETEYILCVNNDGLFRVRGLSQMEGTKALSIQKNKPKAELPKEAKRAIEAYREKYADK